MTYYLGIDGGGTKTKVIVTNHLDEVLYENQSGPSSVDTVALDVTFLNIYKALEDFMKDESITFSAIFAGLGGIVFDKDKELVKNKLYDLPGVTLQTKIMIENDMYNALYSGLLFEEGMCLIAGTGMVAFGQDKLNHKHKSGGWGFKEGELGSGYHLGIEAIRYMIRCYDGRYQFDDFSKEIADKIVLEKPSDIIPIMDELHLNRTKVASLAPVVTKHANLGNLHALHIIEKATDELALAIRAVYKNLQLDEPKIVIVGSLGNVDGRFKELLHHKIRMIDPLIQILKPIVDPALAAALYASKQ